MLVIGAIAYMVIHEYIGVNQVNWPEDTMEKSYLLNGVSGEPNNRACYGPGKVHWAERFAAEHDIDLGASWFYTDSYSDLPMLERVGVARVVNPDTRLKRHAQRVGWPVEDW